MRVATATDQTGQGEGDCEHCTRPVYLLEDDVDALVFGAGYRKWVHAGTHQVDCPQSDADRRRAGPPLPT